MSNYGDEFYPDDWSEPDRDFWDSQITSNPIYYEDREDWDAAQEAFETGWMRDQHEHDATEWQEILDAREHYYELSGTDADDFNWQAWREFMGY